MKVVCIDNDGYSLTIGKTYDVIDVNDGKYKIRNDGGLIRIFYYRSNLFKKLDDIRDFKLKELGI